MDRNPPDVFKPVMMFLKEFFILKDERESVITLNSCK